MIKNCGHCKWSTLIQFGNKDLDWELKDYLECHHEKILNGEKYDVERSELYAEDAASINDTYFRLSVGPEFGCVHWEKREGLNDD